MAEKEKKKGKETRENNQSVRRAESPRKKRKGKTTGGEKKAQDMQGTPQGERVSGKTQEVGRLQCKKKRGRNPRKRAARKGKAN